MTIPDFMPVISAGGHSDPRQGACVMEYISLLAGEDWSDEPTCTHPLLSSMARAVNDRLCHDHRQLLIPLIPRLMGTTGLNRRTEEDLYDWLKAQHPNTNISLSIIIACDVVWSVMREPVAGECESPCKAGIALLTGALDKYDEITGRTEPTEVSNEALRALAEVVKQ